MQGKMSIGDEEQGCRGSRGGDVGSRGGMLVIFLLKLFVLNYLLQFRLCQIVCLMPIVVVQGDEVATEPCVGYRM